MRTAARIDFLVASEIVFILFVCTVFWINLASQVIMLGEPQTFAMCFPQTGFCLLAGMYVIVDNFYLRCWNLAPKFVNDLMSISL